MTLEESKPLLSDVTRKRSRRKLWPTLVLLLLIGSIATSLILIYSPCLIRKCLPLKIMSMNTWGMPAAFGSQYKTERMEAIAKEISKGTFDVYLLQELWMEPDHDKIASNIPNDYHITGFRQLSLASCDGRVLPTSCSGLTTISKYPFKEIEFDAYSDHGDIAKMFVDGEVFARKGVGRVQIEPAPGFTVDIFNTHTIADPDASHGYDNSFYRKKQVRELMDKRIAMSRANVSVLAGDFNAGPVEAEGSAFEMVRREMQDTVEELYYKLKRWLDPTFSTYGNPSNTFSGGLYQPVMYDYIFRRTNTPHLVNVWTSWFHLPLFKTKITRPTFSNAMILRDIHKEDQLNNSTKKHEGTMRFRSKGATHVQSDQTLVPISFSDHEAITSTIYMKI